MMLSQKPSSIIDDYFSEFAISYDQRKIFSDIFEKIFEVIFMMVTLILCIE